MARIYNNFSNEDFNNVAAVYNSLNSLRREFIPRSYPDCEVLRMQELLRKDLDKHNIPYREEE